ncbi:hypothetical protein VTH82DRAFT_5241 [Thermothelomyces myriococcoides]
MSDVPQSHIHPVFSPNPDPVEAEREAQELGRYLLAKSYFDCKEFERCAAVFLPEPLLASLLGTNPNEVANPKGKGKAKATAALPSEDALPEISQKSMFLALYAKFLAGEKQKEEETEMIMGPQDSGSVINKQLVVVSRFLSKWFAQRKADGADYPASQGFLEYLYGMVLAKEKNDNLALDYLMQSVHLFPWNWGAWLEITNLISRVEQLNKIAPHLPQNIMSFIFHANAAVNLYQQGPDLASSLNDLLEIFPTSSFLLTCKALLCYHSKDLFAAEQEFNKVLALHPYRLDSLDHYSNILYVLNRRPKLAFLAHLCSNIDKFRPESCVVIGNYYSLLSLHEKAVQYFRRALTLDRSCLSAWTLMGHEFVELKNTHAAIESYRRAVDVNRRDYRAWYGLGQTYEVLEMHAYALWYYKKAAGLRPWDAKMWQAVEGGQGGGGRAAADGGTGVTFATSKARMWLARYAMRAEDYETASRLAMELCQDGVEVEEAKALMREARSRMELAGPSSSSSAAR